MLQAGDCARILANGMRYDREHKAQTRERVLAQAATAVRRDGAERVGVAAIMRDAGLTHGGFYAHWPSRDALLADAVDRAFADGRRALFADADRRDPAELLGGYVDAYLSLAHRDAPERGCPAPILAGELHRLPGPAADRFRAAIAAMHARVAEQLERLGLDDARARADSALSEMVGAVALSRSMDDDGAAALLAAARVSVRRKLGLAPAP